MREYRALQGGRPRCAGLPLAPSCCWWRVRWRASMRTPTDRRRGWRGALASAGAEEGSSERGGKARGRPQRAGRRTRGEASQMLAHLEGIPEQRENSPASLDVWSAYRLLLIGDKQSPFARGAQAILKFLKEEPGFGLKSLRSASIIKTGKWADKARKRPSR